MVCWFIRPLTQQIILTQMCVYFVLMALGISCTDQETPLNEQNLALTSPKSGGRSVGIVRLQTKGHEVCFCLILIYFYLLVKNNILKFKMRETFVPLLKFLSTLCFVLQGCYYCIQHLESLGFWTLMF
jgi:hypothetical protein